MPQLNDLKQALWQIETLQATLNALKQKVAAQMEPDRDDAGKLRCWACGGPLRRTVYKYNCKQDNGPCGYITVAHEYDTSRGTRKMWFTPTQTTHEGQPVTHQCCEHHFIHLFIVAGEVVGDIGERKGEL
jgi:hypothetical protein